MALDEREALTDRPLLVRSLIVLALVTVAFALHGVLHYEPSVVALLGAGLLLLVAGRDLQPFLREVEWPTLAFFAGLFIMVGALIKTGVIAQLAEAVAAATGGSPWVGSMLLLWASGVLSAIVDNIPYVATMAPVIATLVQDFQGDGDATVLWCRWRWARIWAATPPPSAPAQWRHPGPGSARRPTHPLSSVHQVRRRGRGRDHAGLCPVPVAALLRPRLTRSAAVDAGDDMIRRRHGVRGRSGDRASMTPPLHIRKDPWQLQLCRPSPLAG